MSRASDARGALSFLTPFGGGTVPSPRSLAWFPLVGLGVGGLLGGIWWVAGRWWPAAVAAAVVVAADLGCTGMLHLDGLADAADGLLPHADAARRLDIMRQPTLGAFGMGAAGAALLLRFAALSALRPSVVLLAGVWAASRTVMAVAVVALPYARAESGGLATVFGSGVRPAQVAAVTGTALSVAFVVWWRPLAGSVALAAGAVAAGGVLWLSQRRLRGYTGDVLGAAGMVLETVALVVAAARW